MTVRAVKRVPEATGRIRLRDRGNRAIAEPVTALYACEGIDSERWPHEMLAAECATAITLPTPDGLTVAVKPWPGSILGRFRRRKEHHDAKSRKIKREHPLARVIRTRS